MCDLSLKNCEADYEWIMRFATLVIPQLHHRAAITSSNHTGMNFSIVAFRGRLRFFFLPHSLFLSAIGESRLPKQREPIYLAGPRTQVPPTRIFERGKSIAYIMLYILQVSSSDRERARVLVCIGARLCARAVKRTSVDLVSDWSRVVASPSG